jgi:hypothetical protein
MLCSMGADHRYRFEYACPLRFEDMPQTTNADRRRCSECQRDVVRVHSEMELRAAVNAGRCVAFSRTKLGDLVAPSPTPIPAGRPDAPDCRFVPLRADDVVLDDGDPEASRYLGRDLMERFDAWPVKLGPESGVLHVAFGRPPDASAIDTIQRLTGFVVVPHLANPELIAARVRARSPAREPAEEEHEVGIVVRRE